MAHSFLARPPPPSLPLSRSMVSCCAPVPRRSRCVALGLGQVCTRGHVCPEGTASPVPCPQGTFSGDRTGLSDPSQCFNCTAGGCVVAPHTHECDRRFITPWCCIRRCGGTRCFSDCAAVPRPSQIALAPVVCALVCLCVCARGACSYCPGTGLAQPVPCAPGRYNPLPGRGLASDCGLCDAGWACPGSGTSFPSVQCRFAAPCVSCVLPASTIPCRFDAPCVSYVL